MQNLINLVPPIILPIFIIPIFIKFILTPIIFHHLKQKYLKPITRDFGKSYYEQRDLDALDFLLKFAFKDLNSPHVISYNQDTLIKKFTLLFQGVSHIYTNDEASLKFSVQKLLEASYLFFKDIKDEYNKFFLYRLLKTLRVSFLLRLARINKNLGFITKNRIFIFLNKHRITTRIIRILAIPVLGVPLYIFQLVSALFFSTIFEGYLRFIYGLTLLKFGYYSIYLFSKRESSINSAISFNKKNIKTQGLEIEKDIHRFMADNEHSINFPVAREYIDSSLGNNDLTKKISKILISIFTEEPRVKIGVSQIKTLVLDLAGIYYPLSANPVLELRLMDLVSFGYKASTLLLTKLYTLPATDKMIDKIPITLVVDVTKTLNKEEVKSVLPHIGTGLKFLRQIRGIFTISKFIVSKSHPASLGISLIIPAVSNQILEFAKENVYLLIANISIATLEDSFIKKM